MREAHVTSMLTLGEPFRHDAPVPYPFANQTITDRVREQIPIMVRERLRPPPPETYSLNRKLSGAFLLCARLRARVNCRDLFEQVTQSKGFHTWAPPSDMRAYSCAYAIRQRRRHARAVVPHADVQAPTS